MVHAAAASAPTPPAAVGGPAGPGWRPRRSGHAPAFRHPSTRRARRGPRSGAERPRAGNVLPAPAAPRLLRRLRLARSRLQTRPGCRSGRPLAPHPVPAGRGARLLLTRQTRSRPGSPAAGHARLLRFLRRSPRRQAGSRLALRACAVLSARDSGSARAPRTPHSVKFELLELHES